MVERVLLSPGAATEITLALIKSKTDNLDVALSTLESITASVANLPSDYPDAAALAKLEAIRALVAATLTIAGVVAVSNHPVEFPLPGAQLTTLTPQTDALTDSELRAAAVPVSGTFFQATQPVSAVALPLPAGAGTEATLALIKAKTDNLDVALSTRAVTGLTDTQLRATPVPVSGPLTDTQLRAVAVPVSGTFFQDTQPVSGPLTDTQLRAVAVPVDTELPAAASLADGSANPTAPSVGANGLRWNGATWDRERGNTSEVELASASRTTTQTGADRTNHNSRGLHLIVNVTVAGVLGITVTIQGKSASGVYYPILVGAALTGTGTTVMKLYPGIVAVANMAASDILPRIYRILVTANDGNAVTYSVDREMVV